MNTYLYLPNTPKANRLRHLMLAIWAVGYRCHDGRVKMSTYDFPFSDAAQREIIRKNIDDYKQLTNRAAARQAVELNEKGDLPLSADDSAVIYVPLDKADDSLCSLNKVMELCLKIRQPKPQARVTLVCEVDCSGVNNGRPVNQVAERLRFAGELGNGHVIVCGLRRDAASDQFTTAQTLTALLDAMISCDCKGTPRQPVAKEGMAYTPRQLASCGVAEALGRAWQISRFVKAVKDRNTSLRDWCKRVGTQYAGEGILALWEKVFDEVCSLNEGNNFDIANAVPGLDKIVARLAATRKLKKQTSPDERNNVIYRSVMEAVGATKEISKADSDTISHNYEAYSPQLSADTWELTSAGCPLSPTYIEEVTAEAFEPDLIKSPEARRVRWSILDLWQLFYGPQRPADVKVSVVEENEDSLCLTTTGRRRLASKRSYRIELSTGAVAISSVLTGFAFPPNAYQSYAPHGRELSSRPEDFQQFVYAYLRLFPHDFSPAFRSYVERETQEAQQSMRAEQLNLFGAWPQLCEEVAIDFAPTAEAKGETGA